MLVLTYQFLNRQINRTEKKKTKKTHDYNLMIFPKGAKANQWGRDRLSNKWCWNLVSNRKKWKGMTEDEMVEWHHQLNGHEFEQALGVGGGQGNLACCSPWGCKESDTTEQLN